MTFGKFLEFGLLHSTSKIWSNSQINKVKSKICQYSWIILTVRVINNCPL